MSKENIILATKRIAKWLLKRILLTDEITESEIEDLFRRMKVNLQGLSLEEIIKIRDYLNYILDCAKLSIYCYPKKKEKFLKFVNKYYGEDKKKEVEKYIDSHCSALIMSAVESIKRGV